MRPLTRLALICGLTAAGALSWIYLHQAQPVAVRVQAARVGMVEETVANTRAGTIMACRRARLAPSVGGQIATLAVREGARVQSGDLLLELWNRDLRAQVTLAEREADAGEAKARAACLHAENAERESDRQVKLSKRSMASEEAVERAITGAKSARADCEAAQATARVGAAKIAVAQAELAKTRLIAPFAGVVAEVSGEVNEYVTPSPPGIPTPPAVDLIDDACFYVSAPIDEVDAAKVRLGAEARVTLDAFGKRVFLGTVRRIAPYVLDQAKQARTVEVEVVIAEQSEDDPQERGNPPSGTTPVMAQVEPRPEQRPRRPDGEATLLAGYSADVEVLVERREGVLRIPTAAVRPGGGVLVLDSATGKLRDQAIETGVSNWEQTQVTSGLAEGDLVVLSLDRAGVVAGAAAVAEEGPSESKGQSK
jgi:HlyD family secretion protein